MTTMMMAYDDLYAQSKIIVLNDDIDMEFY